MTHPYRPVIEVCKAIIMQSSIENSSIGNHSAKLAYFIDIADLWELYLLRLLQEQLDGYNVYSPNVTGGEYLLKKEARQIRPDIIIEKDGKVLMIIDAKYKNYKEFGKDTISYSSVRQEDLNQMSTYLMHYSKYSENKIFGLFTSPAIPSDSENGSKLDIHEYCNNDKYSIGLLNLPIEKVDTLADKELNYYIKNLENGDNKDFIMKAYTKMAEKEVRSSEVIDFITKKKEGNALIRKKILNIQNNGLAKFEENISSKIKNELDKLDDNYVNAIKGLLKQIQ